MDAISAERVETPVSRMTKPPGAYRHGDLRNALIAAATELTVQRGGPDFTLREIAALTGVRHAAVYRHFASKAALLEEIARIGVDALRTRIAEKAPAAPAARLATLGREYVSFAVTRPGEYRVMAQEGGASPAQYRALLDIVSEPVAAARAAGALRADASVETLSRLYWGQLHGLAMLALNAVVPAAELDECVAAMGRVWLAEKQLQN